MVKIGSTISLSKYNNLLYHACIIKFDNTSYRWERLLIQEQDSYICKSCRLQIPKFFLIGFDYRFCLEAYDLNMNRIGHIKIKQNQCTIDLPLIE